MPSIKDISAWALNGGSGSIVSGDIADGTILTSDVISGQIIADHFASGALVAALGLGGHAFASRTLSGQTASNSGAITTVSGPGLYRVSTYTQVTQGGLSNVGNLSVRLDWTDDGQAQNLSPITGVALVTSGAFGQAETVVRSLSGSAIMMTITLGSTVGTPQYSAFGSVEKLF